METAANKILPYAVELKSVLLVIFNVDSASDVRAQIFPVLSQVNQRLYFELSHQTVLIFS